MGAIGNLALLGRYPNVPKHTGRRTSKNLPLIAYEPNVCVEKIL